jgi:hypothetical protein
MSTPVRAIDRLKAALNKSRLKKELLLSDGSSMEVWFTRMTAAERDAAQKMSEENNVDFAMQLLVNKATDAAGTKMFSQGDIADLKHAVDFEDLQALELAILKGDGEGPIAVKSSDAGAVTR